MKWIALQCLDEKNEFLVKHIPIFIPLKQFGKDPQNTFRKNNIREISLNVLRSNNIYPGFFKESFDDNRILFLLDGLDEVADEKIRREIIDWIQKQNILRSLLIVTSRFSGIHVAKGIVFNSSIEIYEIQNFSIEDTKTFLRNWYRNIEFAVDDQSDEATVLKRVDEKSADLIKAIETNKNLRLLAINPLLLTIIAIVHRTRAVLPKERHKLYEEAIKVMVELWHLSNKKLELKFSFENSIANISTLAFHLMKNNTREMAEIDILKLLPKNIERQPANVFLAEMLLKSGLLYVSEGKLGFLHLTFQEYLTARYFAQSDNQNDIIEYIEKDFWIETIRLFINVGNAATFFNQMFKLVKQGKYKNLNFLLELANEVTVEENKNKFVNYILNLLAPELIRFADTESDNQIVFEKYYPSMSVYLTYGDKTEHIFWRVLNESKNLYTKVIAIIVLLNSSDEIRRKTVTFRLRCTSFAHFQNRIRHCL